MMTAGPRERAGLMLQPSNGMAHIWAMKTANPMAKGASTCTCHEHRIDPLHGLFSYQLKFPIIV